MDKVLDHTMMSIASDLLISGQCADSRWCRVAYLTWPQKLICRCPSSVLWYVAAQTP
jgi:hypothetical protein